MDNGGNTETPFYVLQLTASSHILLISAHLLKVNGSSQPKTVKAVSRIERHSI